MVLKSDKKTRATVIGDQGFAGECGALPFFRQIHRQIFLESTNQMGREMKPSIEEFEIKGDSVVHTPTNAMWSAFPGSPAVSFHRPSDLKRPNGIDYRPEEVAHIARKLLAERLPIG